MTHVFTFTPEKQQKYLNIVNIIVEIEEKCNRILIKYKIINGFIAFDGKAADWNGYNKYNSNWYLIQIINKMFLLFFEIKTRSFEYYKKLYKFPYNCVLLINYKPLFLALFHARARYGYGETDALGT